MPLKAVAGTTTKGGPKKPIQAYFIFCNEERQKLKEEFTSEKFTMGEQSRIISLKWKTLTDEEKSHYTELSKQDKERYLR